MCGALKGEPQLMYVSISVYEASRSETKVAITGPSQFGKPTFVDLASYAEKLNKLFRFATIYLSPVFGTC